MSKDVQSLLHRTSSSIDCAGCIALFVAAGCGCARRRLVTGQDGAVVDAWLPGHHLPRWQDSGASVNSAEAVFDPIDDRGTGPGHPERSVGLMRGGCASRLEKRPLGR